MGVIFRGGGRAIFLGDNFSRIATDILFTR